MILTLELSSQTYQQLEKRAQTSGATVAEVAVRLLDATTYTSLNTLIEEMQVEGLFADPPAVMPLAPLNFQPIQVQGKPLSEVILEERR